MIDTHRRALLTVLLAVGLCAAAASGQAKPTIPSNIKSSAALTPADVEAVNKFVAAQFKLLSDPSVDAQKQAREALINESKGGGATVDYQTKYATAVNAEAQALLKNEKGVRPRLSTAIVVARVAENTASTKTVQSTASTKLAPAALDLLKDGEVPAIQAWGMKAARAMMKDLVAAGGNAPKPVIDRVVPVVKANPTGPLTEEAYDVLIAADALAVDALLDLSDVRLALYQKGTPEDPGSDSKPWSHLGSAGTWATLNKQQQLRTMEGMCATLTLAAKRGDEADGVVEEQLRDVVSKTAANMFVVLGTLPNPPQVVTTTLMPMLRQIASNARGQTFPLVSNTANVCPAVRQIPAFAQMKQPPAAADAGAAQ